MAEANDLSDEEGEVDDSVSRFPVDLRCRLIRRRAKLLAIRNRGASFLIPLGKKLTLLEEQADVGTFVFCFGCHR